MFVVGITELQFIAYLQLIRYRLKMINFVLRNFRELTNEKNSPSHSFQMNMGASGTPEETFFMKEISASFKQKRSLKLVKRNNSVRPMKQKDQKELPDAREVPKVGLSRNGKLLLNAVRAIAIMKPMEHIFKPTHFRNADNSATLMKIQQIYTRAERVAILINAAYGIQLIIILVIKFTTLTSLMYVCCMILIK